MIALAFYFEIAIDEAYNRQKKQEVVLFQKEGVDIFFAKNCRRDDDDDDDEEDDEDDDNDDDNHKDGDHNEDESDHNEFAIRYHKKHHPS